MLGRQAQLVDHMRMLAATLVTEGIVDREDEDDAALSLVRQLERWGYLPQGRGDAFRAELLTPARLVLLKDYVDFCKAHGNDWRARKAKLRQLGMSSAAMIRLARRYLGRGQLKLLGAPSSAHLVREILRERGWLTRRQIRRLTGVTAGSLSGSLAHALRHGWVIQRKGAGEIEYGPAPDAALPQQPQSACEYGATA